MNCNTQIMNFSIRALRQYWTFRRNLEFAGTELKLTAYKSPILPTIEYASHVLEPFRQQTMHQTKRIQSKAVRLLFNRYLSTDCLLTEIRCEPSAMSTMMILTPLKSFLKLLHADYFIDIKKIWYLCKLQERH